MQLILETGVLVLLYHLNLVYKATSTTYSHRGGNSNVGFNCGFAYILLVNSSSLASWFTGAALSFKSYIKLRVLHMHIVVAVVVIVIIVVSFMLISGVCFLVLTGIMVPPYHLNKATSTAYAFRSYGNRAEYNCGVFAIRVGSSSGATDWQYGAALSFKPYEIFYCDYFYQSGTTHYTTRGGAFNGGFICGAFAIGLAGAFNYTGTQIGASLSFKLIAAIIVIIFIKVLELIISLVVAIHIMVIHVELSLFIHFILIQLPIGLLVLLYHLN